MDNPNEDDRLAAGRRREQRAMLATFLVLFLICCVVFYVYSGIQAFMENGLRGRLAEDLIKEDVYTPPPVLAYQDTGPRDMHPVVEPGFALPDDSAHPGYNPYIRQGESFSAVRGIVTDIVPREDGMPGGSRQINYYARTQYTAEGAAFGCYFHHFLGPDRDALPVRAGDAVWVSYQPDVADTCGSSVITGLAH